MTNVIEWFAVSLIVVGIAAMGNGWFTSQRSPRPYRVSGQRIRDFFGSIAFCYIVCLGMWLAAYLGHITDLYAVVLWATFIPVFVDLLICLLMIWTRERGHH